MEFKQWCRVLVIMVATGCKPSSLLNVPPPATQIGFGGLTERAQVEAVFNGAKTTVFTAMAESGPPGLIEIGGVLTDEMVEDGPGDMNNIDARYTSATELPGYAQFEAGDGPLINLYTARSALLLSIGQLRQAEPASGLSKVGEAYALIGYIELQMAENYCAGAPLSYAVGGGGYVFGTPLTTDSLLGTAETHFDSALANVGTPVNDTILYLASVGLGRARLDRGHFLPADSAVANVPPSFVYNVQMEPNASDGAPGAVNLYEQFRIGNGGNSSGCYPFNVGDQEGGNGLNFVSAHDPRLVLDSTVEETCGGYYSGYADSVYYYPIKFGDPVNSGLIPMATGVEAALVVAEAALANHDATWLSDLNGLRNSGCRGSADSSCTLGTGQVTGQPWGLQPLTDPGSDSARASLLFRERAFWLYSTGTRLSDLRRLIRQYGRPANTVFPVGPYPHGLSGALQAPIANYGPDVNLTLPTTLGAGGEATVNPNYHGCLTLTTTA